MELGLRKLKRITRVTAGLLLGAWSAGCQTNSLAVREPAVPASVARGQSEGPYAADPEPEKVKEPKKRAWNWAENLDPFNWFVPTPPPPPTDTVVIRADGVAPDRPLEPGSPEANLAGAREFFRRGEYSKAEGVFRKIADNKKHPVAVIEEARYYQAECLRLQGYYPRAADVYNDLLSKFPGTSYREQATQHMFDIANYWLDDTRAVMRETREKREGKRYWINPRFVHFEKSKPLLDREGRAIEKLEQVRYHDINGPLADKAMFLAGSVKFFNEDYREADYLFSQIHERHPNSPLASQAVELAILSKHMSTGGADYDGRKVAEARKLVQAAFESYPELAGNEEKRQFLLRQLVSITEQQAEKDYKMAEFYKRTGHPGSAYFYFEIVRRCYPNTRFAELANQQMEELRVKLENDPNAAAGGAPAPRPRPTNLPEQAPAPRVLPPTLDR